MPQGSRPRFTQYRCGNTLWLLAFGVLLAFAPTRSAMAQADFPNHPLRLVIAFGPGGVADTTSRVVAEKIGEILGQRVVVENNPGGGGISAARAVLNAPADGYSLALLTNGTSITVGLFKSLPFDPVRDFAPVSRIGAFEFFFAAKADGPHASMQALLAAAKATPGKLNIGTIVPGSTQHLSALLLKSTAGVDFQWVPFKTAPDLIVALLRGDVDAIVEGIASLKGNVDDGKLKLIATTAGKRGPVVPDVPTVAESGGGAYDVTSWNGLFAKAGTDPALIQRLNGAVRQALADADVKAKLLTVGIIADPSTPQELAAFLKADIAKWEKVIDDNRIEKR